ncbi:MAG: protein phosphatase 2C domain-containing protein [Acidimicrobiia bacterium]|nr:protein phosphatase 2C domain-containing protein [Acidimicrobiia bacterium]
MLITRALMAGLSDVGRVRGENEDQFLVADLNRSMTIHASTLPVDDETQLYSGMIGQLLVVADGISGAPGAVVASQIGVGTVARYVLNTMPWFLSLNHDHDDDQEKALLAALLEVESAVEEQARVDPEFAGMGTTLTMAYIVWPRLYVVNVGDSRCYLLRDGTLEQLTHDQTAAAQLVEDGTLSPEQAARSPLSRILVSSIGQGMSSFRPDVYRTELVSGDRLLLCTDGLTAMVDDLRISRMLGEGDTPETVCQALADEANEAGGHDNITVAVAFCLEPMERQT